MVNLKSSKLIFCNIKCQFELEGQGQYHQFLKITRDLYMINTHLKFEAKIPNGSKVVAFTKNYTKFLSLKANLTLNVKLKVTSF